MNWPKGKYNGKRICGVSIKIKINVLGWHWWPLIENQWGVIAVHWLCVWTWTSWEYEGL